MMSMGFPPFALTDDELRRTERLDGDVFNVLVAAGVTERFMWTCPVAPEQRVISLRLLGREHEPIAQFTETEFVTFSDGEILARIRAGLGR